MKANQQDEKTADLKKPSPQPQASRPAPRMEQRSAREAGVYHVLPVLEDDIIYSVTSSPMAIAAGEIHYAVACNTAGKEIWKTQFYAREYIPQLETDVQNFFIVDLYVTEQHVCIKPEHGGMITINKQNGQVLNSR